MVVKTISALLNGVDASVVCCEAVASPGVRFAIIGMTDTSIKESRDRIEYALREVGLNLPQFNITVNLTPADVRKEGAFYDLPIAISILAATNKIPADKLADYMLVGELSLNGELRAVKGCLPYAILARKMKLKGIIVPTENAAEAAVVNNLDVLMAHHLKEVVGFFKGENDLPQRIMDTRQMFMQAERKFSYDFADVKGQVLVKRAFAIAAAGGHNLIMVGPPGAGKSMMAKCLPSILPPLSLSEALETTKIHSVAGIRAETGLITCRPFRAPHHIISSVALLGGGSNPLPGEVSLAHNGVLFLDELPEFSKAVLEVLRQPLEDRKITIARAKNTVTYPSSVMLVASMNPCPCGYYNHPTKPCTCTETQVRKYLGKVSGPLLDRIDLQIEILPLSFEEMSRTTVAESSAAIRERVIAARKIQEDRYKNIPDIHCNAQMTPNLLRQYCVLDEKANESLKNAMEKNNLSARAYDRILKVARTIADYEGHPNITLSHISEAINYRNLDSSTWGQHY